MKSMKPPFSGHCELVGMTTFAVKFNYPMLRRTNN